MRGVRSGLLPPLGLAVSMAALLAACSGTTSDTPRGRVSRPAFSEDEYGVRTSPRVADGSGRLPKGGGEYKLGSPYKVAGRWYVPREDRHYDRTGIGSWYGDDFHGRKTANGEIFDMHALTAAHPTLPLPSYAYVTNLQNGRTILVRVNDRGPYVNDRIIDLSHASARALGYEGEGRAHVRVRYAGRAPLNGDDQRERQYLASQFWVQGGGAVAARGDRTPPPPAYGAPYRAAAASGGWSAAEYRAGLAGKDVPRGFAEGSSRQLAVSSAPPGVTSADARRYARYDADTAPGTRTDGLVWRASPPSQPLPWVASSANSVGRSALGGGASAALPASRARAAYVQVGLFRELARAEALRGNLGTLAPVEVAGVDEGSGLLYRVRLGPMPPERAQAALAAVNARGVKGGSIVFE